MADCHLEPGSGKGVESPGRPPAAYMRRTCCNSGSLRGGRATPQRYPSRITQSTASFWAKVIVRFRSSSVAVGQPTRDAAPFRLNPSFQSIRGVRHDEACAAASVLQRLREGQTPHEVPGPDLRCRVGGYYHAQAVPAGRMNDVEAGQFARGRSDAIP